MNTICQYKNNSILTQIVRAVGILAVILATAGFPLESDRVLAHSAPRIYAQLTDDSIRFEYSAPGVLVTFSIYDAPGGILLWEDSITADDSGFATVSIWDHRVDLKPGISVAVSDGTITKDLWLEPVSLDVFDPDENILAGTAAAGRSIWAVANNETAFCGTEATANAIGEWTIDFDEQGCDITEDMWAYAQVFDAEDDTTEAIPDFIDGWHDYDQGDVPNWACNAGGWAIDTDDRARDLAIRILADGNQVASTTSGNPTDLLGVCGADGSCGYEVSLWGLITPYEEHEITVQAYDQETDQWFSLNGTPKPLTCRTYDIYVLDMHTGETREVTTLTDSDEFNPKWSPDHKKIVFDVVHSDGSLGTYVVDVQSGVSAPLAGAEDGGNDPAWSPSGKWIAFDRYWYDDPSLYLVPSSGGARKLLREDAIMASWAPNSQRIAFVRPSDWSVWTMGLNGGDVTFIAADSMIPAWSPEGEWIAYQHAGNIWKVRVNLEGVPLGDPIQVTSTPGEDSRPTWSNNSKTIAFHSGLGRDYDIWTVPAAGGMATWLTGAPEFGDYDPAYSFNGRYIAYASFSPAGQAARSWVAAFTYDLPAGTLSDGTYPYHFELEWSVPEPGAFSGQGGEFVISEQAPIYEGCVLLRGPMELRGVESPEGLNCEEVDLINLDQPVRFLIGWVTEGEMTYPEALAFFNSMTARAIWGEGMSAELVRHEIIPFSWDDPDRWFQYVCTFTGGE